VTKLATVWELDKAKVPQWLEVLRKDCELIAPVKNYGEVLFMSSPEVSQVVLDYDNTLVPPKEFFLPPTETMFSFTESRAGFHITLPEEAKNRIIFGVRPCDVNALLILDKVFNGELRDEYYLSRREKTTLIALNCNQPGEKCFCGSVGAGPSLSGKFDILLTDIGDVYFIEVGSAKGNELINKLPALFREASQQSEEKKEAVVRQAQKLFAKPIDPLEVAKRMEAFFNDAKWTELGERCMECGGCTYVCPTCYCFDVVDRIENGKGLRLRYWDCCLLPGFTRMAGGLNPRGSKEARMKQRFYHKWDYFVQRFGMLQCVGCGRCSKTALCSIDWGGVFKSIVGGS